MTYNVVYKNGNRAKVQASSVAQLKKMCFGLKKYKLVKERKYKLVKNKKYSKKKSWFEKLLS